MGGHRRVSPPWAMRSGHRVPCPPAYLPYPYLVPYI